MQGQPTDDFDLPTSKLVERQIAELSKMPRRRYLWSDDEIDRIELKRLARERAHPHEERDDD